MAESIVKLKVESTEYDAKVKRAAQGLQRLADECHKVGGTLEVVEKDQLEFAQSLGDMVTVAKDAKGQLRELQTSISNISVVYNDLTEAEKKSPFGQALDASMKKLTERAGKVQDAIDDTRASIRNAASDTRSFDQAAGAVSMLTSSMQIAQGGAKLLGIEMGDNVEVLAKLQAAMAVTNGLQTIQNLLQKQSALMQGLNAAKTTIAATAQGLYAIATGNAAAAQTAFNVAAAANPYGAILAVVGLAAAGVMAFANSVSNATDEENKQTDATKRLADAHNKFRTEVSNAVSDVVSKYMVLQQQWKQVRNTAEQNDWLKKHANDWKAYGKSINSVNEANAFYIKNAPAVIEALAAIAEAEAAQGLYKEAVTEELKRKMWKKDHPLGATDYSKIKTTSQLSEDDQKYIRSIRKPLDQRHNLSDEERSALRERSEQHAKEQRAATDAKYAHNTQNARSLMDEAAAKALRLSNRVGISMYGGSFDSGNNDKKDDKKDPKEPFDPSKIRYAPALPYKMGIDTSMEDAEAERMKELMKNGLEGLFENIFPELREKYTHDPSKPKEKKEKGINQTGQLVNGVNEMVGGLEKLGIEVPEGIKKGLGFLQALIGIVSGISTIVSAIAIISSTKFLAGGGIVRAAGGFNGIVPGNYPSGDLVNARLNSGEIVLNKAQQGNLASQLEGGGLGNMHLVAEVGAEDLRFVLNNNSMRRGMGEYVTSKRR